MSEVRFEVEDEIAVVTVNNPPVNALSFAVRKGLVDAARRAEATDAVRAVVLVCEGRTFMAGADVHEFGRPPKEPHLPDAIDLIEASAKPWVAAIHGTALGGGLEVALGCAGRVAMAGARVGLPEVHLGILPGAGGTVRLPRLIDPVRALGMIVSGKPVGATEAANLGLIDAVVDNLRAGGIARAREIADGDRPVPLPARQVSLPRGWKAEVARATSRTRGQIAPVRAAEQVTESLRLPAREAMARERATFLKLKDDPQSLALRHIFLAERSATRMPELKAVAARPVETVGVVGGGTMGAGIAAACLLSGLPVTLIERDKPALLAGIDRVTSVLDASAAHGVIPAVRCETLKGELTGALHYTALGRADLVIEAVFEDMDVKKQVFAQLDTACRPEAVLATNTSYLDVNELAATVADPARVLGLHFFSPAHVMKLLEIVRPDRVADDVLATGFVLGKRLGKVPVVAGVCDGFIGNRILTACRRECDYMVADGAWPQEIDAAMRAYGYPMGIFEMQDMAGLEIGWAARKRRASTRPAPERYVHIADRICEMGRFGQKTGAGWYLYPEGTRKGQPDPVVEQIIREESDRAGITRRDFTAEEIINRILGAMAHEGRAILAEGIAASPEAIDVVLVNGYGFPRWHGGPMFASGQTG
ncbi:MAG: enoyl-CoA hydratase/isomerase family protein [Rhodobacteraceae bacterium]|nr:enoyl-CoA hydratase/isomerase family protein [Paracoccaceae bacterium]